MKTTLEIPAKPGRTGLRILSTTRNSGIFSCDKKTTLDIPDELYREAEAKAVGQRREVEDLVNGSSGKIMADRGEEERKMQG